eukprot:4965017-Alexandrium_andersonii.AAC.1
MRWGTTALLARVVCEARLQCEARVSSGALQPPVASTLSAPVRRYNCGYGSPVAVKRARMGWS